MLTAPHHCFIAPINYLHLIPKESRVHLCLAHLLTNPVYVEFYKQRQQQGDFIILDNSAFEFKKPIEAHELFELCNKAQFEPNCVVAPDYVFENWEKTVKSTEDFVKQYTKYFAPNTAIMAVPQSIKGDVEGWLNCYEQLSNISEVDFIGMSILGIPNAFCSLTGTEDISINRIFATVYMKQRELVNGFVKHHYLGLGSNVRELLIQKELGVMFSNDSSSAIWHGINGIRYDATAGALKNGKLSKEVDFNLPFNPETIPDIQHNIDYLNRLLNT